MTSAKHILEKTEEESTEKEKLIHDHILFAKALDMMANAEFAARPFENREKARRNRHIARELMKEEHL